MVLPPFHSGCQAAAGRSPGWAPHLGNLNTIIKIERVISLAHRNFGLYRCCASFVNLGTKVIHTFIDTKEAPSLGRSFGPEE